jgi:hypothetical protein
MMSSAHASDFVVCNVFLPIFGVYEHVNIKLFLAGCSADIRRTMVHAETYKKIPEHHIFVELHDAIAVARSQSIGPLPRSLEDFTYDEAAEESYVTNM